MSVLAIWTMDKTVALTGQRRHFHKGLTVAPGFTAPALVPQITFSPTALAASIARTATLLPAPPEAISRLADSAMIEAEMYIADGHDFAISPLLATFVESERSHFAGRVGAGITDLYMNALGYSWRDNATILSSALNPHADFIYYGGNAVSHGVVLAEARGSFANNTSDATLARAAQQKYLRQVRPYIGVKSIYGDVIHGYALAFGSRPGVIGSILRISQTRRSATLGHLPTTPSPGGPAQVPTLLALAAQRSNFILMNAFPVVDWIDWLRGAREFPEDSTPVEFLRFNFGGRTFLASSSNAVDFWWLKRFSDLSFRFHRWRPRWGDTVPRLDWFVMEENQAASFLNSLSAIIRFGPRGMPEVIEQTAGDIEGFGVRDSEDDPRARREYPVRPGDYDYALFRDGLALLGGPPPRRITGVRSWNPKDGLSAAKPLEGEA